MTFFTRLFARRGRRATKRPILSLVTLEDRTTPNVGLPVPSNFTIVPVGTTANNVNTFSSFSAALSSMIYVGGTITVEPGALAPTAPISTVFLGLVIQGDPNVPSSILPALSLSVGGGLVTLNNLNLSSVTGNPQGSFTITRCTVGNINLVGGFNKTISQNYITGAVTVGGGGGTTPDQIVNNTFVGFSPTMLQMDQDNNAVVKGNTFIGAGVPTGTALTPQTAIDIQSSQNVMIANNTIRLPGNSVAAGSSGTFTAIAIGPSSTSSGTPPVVTYGPVSTGSILNNVLSAGTTGTGLPSRRCRATRPIPMATHSFSSRATISTTTPSASAAPAAAARRSAAIWAEAP